ncbi:MAG TPA: pre-peptidase C-terminal domain-containing protein, partial [Rhodocyclaceae bacterium]|nr:pre-peptidase C-terminal domain-containing protein [Rhodocyclaceae bacterium]
MVLQGVGLRADTDIIVTWTTHQGAKQTDVLRPTNASADGTTAQLDIPAHYNGVLDLRVLGSASRPELQIVPTVRAVDLQNWSDRIVLIGSGYIEGASTYAFTGSSFADTLIDAADANEVVNVWYDYGQNNSVYLRRSAINTHGFGSVTVTTAGGTSAPAEVNFVRLDLGTNKALGDVAVDRTTGALWALDYNRPYELHRIDPGNGRIVQTIVAPVLTAGEDYAYNYAGLQVAPTAFKLGTTDVPAGSLLLFNGYGVPDGGVAAIDAATGAVIATLRLQKNVDLTAGVHDQATGHLWVTSHPSNALKEIDPTSGATLATVALPSGVNVQTHAGLATDPVSGNFWVASSNVGAMLHEIKRDGTLVRSVYAGWQTYNEGEAAGLAFDTDGTLLVASTTGVVYKIDVNRDWAATPSATLTQVVATARDGTPANAGQASANAGDVIELRGTNFNTSTSVLFNTRDDGGSTKVVAINPLLISPDGTKLQVRVPTAATTSEIKVVNRGLQNLGFTNWGGQWTDSIYRKVQVSFTAEASTSNVRFTDAGLEDLADESWGLDNVVVRAANGTVVFRDDFETEAQAAWSNTTVDKSNNTFTAFSGRFGNAAQTLSLSGLTAGETYTVEFDLYVIDSWEGKNINPLYGPDTFKVVVDGQERFSEVFANHGENGEQTFRASAGVPLQIVPKLDWVSAGRPGEDAWGFHLDGSGFQEAATTVTIGGVSTVDIHSEEAPDTQNTNSRIWFVSPRTLDGPIRVTTAGGYDEIAGYDYGAQPVTMFTGITTAALAGAALDASKPSTLTGQNITLTGQGFTGNTLVQFQGIDDTGRVGTLTRTGSASGDGRTLTVTVPALARTGPVTVLGSNTWHDLQIVPLVRSVGGTIESGKTIVLETTGVSQDDVVITIGGRTVGSFSKRITVDSDGANTLDQQLITLVVPNGIANTDIQVSTAGGTSVLRSGVEIQTLAPLASAQDVADTMATATDLGALADQRLSLKATVGETAANDVDLYKVMLEGGTALRVVFAPGTTLHACLRVFDAKGTQVWALQPWAGNNNEYTFDVPTTGTYYLGVSGIFNTDYNPGTTNSGRNSYTGDYTLNLEAQRWGTIRLTAIEGTATSGTPATPALASANVGQTITLMANNLVAADRVVFTTIDANGNLGETVVTPKAIDVASGTIRVDVPQQATTGRVRLERDRAG